MPFRCSRPRGSGRYRMRASFRWCRLPEHVRSGPVPARLKSASRGHSRASSSRGVGEALGLSSLRYTQNPATHHGAVLLEVPIEPLLEI
jgi:hypothetical protein